MIVNEEQDADYVLVVLQDAAISCVNVVEVYSKLTDANWSKQAIVDFLFALMVGVIPFLFIKLIPWGELCAGKKFGITVSGQSLSCYSTPA